MSSIVIFVFWFLVGLAVFQTVFLLRFCCLFWFKVRESNDRQDLPKAAILLPLRGADPKLADTLDALLAQEYPNYEVHIVLDHEEDPSAQYVSAAIAKSSFKNVFVRTIQNKRSTCSPQCSALYEAVQYLDSSHEVVCIIDGDVVAHKTWLKELVRPLQDEKVAIAHGNRWFIPPDVKMGPMVRYLWNAAAIVPMYFLGIPWAGSFAIRHCVLRESGLLEKWPNAIVPDAPSKALVDAMGLKVRFVPELIMANRETCDLWFAHDFLKRQMMWTRTYHPNWWMVVLHALLTTLGILVAVVYLVYVASQSDWVSLGWLGGGLALYVSSLVSMLILEEFAVRRAIRAYDSAVSIFPPWQLVLVPVMIPVTQFVYMSAVLFAHVKKTVRWRGVNYVVRSPWDVSILSDQRFESSDTASESNVSI